MRFHREHYLDLMTFGHAPRPMFCELFGPLVGLADEWRAQGASAGAETHGQVNVKQKGILPATPLWQRLRRFNPIKL